MTKVIDYLGENLQACREFKRYLFCDFQCSFLRLRKHPRYYSSTIVANVPIQHVSCSREYYQVAARQIFDSRGHPTIEAEVVTSDGTFRASVPAGASSGAYDAHEVRDKSKRFHGRGVSKAVEIVNNEISEAIVGMDPTDQEGIDQALRDLDGGDNFERLGANSVLGVSMAVCRAGAAKKSIPLYKHINSLAGNPTMLLPVPSFNVITGGKHAGNKLPFQEFMIMPVGTTSFAEAMMIGTEIYHELRKLMRSKYGALSASAVGDEGGFVANIADPEEALAIILKAVDTAGYKDFVLIGIDVAASEFWDKKVKRYNLNFKSSKTAVWKSGMELMKMYTEYAAKYKVVTIEDPFDQGDWDAFANMTSKLGEMVQIVGDDLLASNPTRIQESINRNAANGVLLKMNQIGTVSDVIEANNTARNGGRGVIVGHRSGDTEDSFIADLAVGLGNGQIKAGAPCRSERLAKYNQLLRIEEDLGKRAIYAGEYFRDPWALVPEEHLHKTM